MKNEIREEIKVSGKNKNELTTIQNLWDITKANLRGKFIAIQAYLKKNRNISNKQPNPTPSITLGTTTKTTQSKYKEGNKQEQSQLK